MHIITDLYTGGAERMLERVVLTSCCRNIDSQVVTLLSGGAVFENLTRANVAVTTLKMRRRFPEPLTLIRLARLIKKEKPAVIQSWLYHADLAATIALLLSRRREKTKLFWNVRCSSIEALGKRWRNAALTQICSWLSNTPDAVIANSEAGRAYHLHLGYRPRHFFVVDNGLDISAFRPDPAARQEVRSELGISTKQSVVAMVARLDTLKDHPTFFRALELLPNTVALLIGSGTESLGPRPNVYRLGERHDVARLLAACDIIVCSSISEGFPNTLIEGMAVGLPAVATDSGDARRIVGDTGIIVPVGDARALADGITTLLSEPAEQRSARQMAARERVATCFSLDRTVSEFDKIWRNGVTD